ncbi:hypothetical protein LINPERHAP2_LOCUS40965, partial [Linum perenne]
ALAALESSPDDLDLVVLAERRGPHVVLLAEVGGERCTHQDTADRRRSSEVSLPALAAGGGNPWIVLHLCLPAVIGAD